MINYPIAGIIFYPLNDVPEIKIKGQAPDREPN